VGLTILHAVAVTFLKKLMTKSTQHEKMGWLAAFSDRAALSPIPIDARMHLFFSLFSRLPRKR
jgi:hypothetical protein